MSSEQSAVPAERKKLPVMSMKYIVWEGDAAPPGAKGADSSPIFAFMLFPHIVVHSDVASMVERGAAHAGIFRSCAMRPVSAGFVTFYSDGSLSVQGRSESMGLESHPEDENIIYTSGYTGGMGFPSRDKTASRRS